MSRSRSSLNYQVPQRPVPVQKVQIQVTSKNEDGTETIFFANAADVSIDRNEDHQGLGGSFHAPVITESFTLTAKLVPEPNGLAYTVSQPQRLGMTVERSAQLTGTTNTLVNLHDAARAVGAPEDASVSTDFDGENWKMTWTWREEV